MMPTQENQIAERSHQIWEREGRPEGKHLQHWYQALAEFEEESAPQEAPSKARRPAAAASRKPASPRRRKPSTGKA